MLNIWTLQRHNKFWKTKNLGVEVLLAFKTSAYRHGATIAQDDMRGSLSIRWHIIDLYYVRYYVRGKRSHHKKNSDSTTARGTGTALARARHRHARHLRGVTCMSSLHVRHLCTSVIFVCARHLRTLCSCAQHWLAAQACVQSRCMGLLLRAELRLYA